MNKLVKSPLLVVDVQTGFVNSKSEHVIPRVKALITTWQSIDWPVYFSQFVNKPGSQWERLIGWRRLRDETEISLHPELEDLTDKGTTYRKESYTCIDGPFRDDLHSQTWTNVVLCGIATDGCVLATAIDLFEFGGRQIRPLVVEDACASHAGHDVHTEGLHLIRRFIGSDQILKSDQLLAMIATADD